jgi:sialate O-acetylesterase
LNLTKIEIMKALLTSFYFLICPLLYAQLTTSALFGDNMVLQRDQPIIIWGTAEKMAPLTVKFAGQSVKVKADRSGKWKAQLEPLPSGGPYKLEILGKKDYLTFKNILMGDVWLCSGQSNMEWPVNLTNNFEEEIASSTNDQIRHLKIPRKTSFNPEDDFEAADWQLAGPNTTGSFTAVGYYFAREIQRETGVAIGLVNSSWGGTNVETWIPNWKIKELADFESSLTVLNRSDEIEALAKQKMEEIMAGYGDIPTDKDAGNLTGAFEWANEDFSSWEDANVPALWENDGLESLDGIVWYATSFTLSQDQLNENIKLNLGPIDDSDITFINGSQVGSMTNAYSKKRVYTVDKSILKAGENTLVVRVEDTGGGGGIYGDPKLNHIITTNGKIDLSGTWKRKIGKAVVNAQVSGPNDFPTLLYNAMIHPIINMPLKGTLWYQGESNAGRSKQYNVTFPAMIESWRKAWGTEFPFYFVQLTSFMPASDQPEGHGWAELREAQTNTLSLPKTGMAVITDIGNAYDIHPRNKQDVGKRLSLIALNNDYEKDELVCSGPMYNTHEVKENQVYISFDEIGSGLMTTNKYGYIQGFSIAGPDQQFEWAQARIEGNQVVVSSDKVKNPVAVRFAWHCNTDDANLYNKEGLPANPFRTDSWEGLTDNNKYEPKFSFE